MSTNYPDGLDVFTEPSLPEETTLSSAGNATRNHTEHHRDLGDAVESLENHAAVKDHDHSGDTDDNHKGAKLSQANTHEGVDTDTQNGIHHKIGPGQYQAAAGNHNHDYNTLINIPKVICTSASRPANPSQGMEILELDTLRTRIWGGFPNNTLATGLFSIDYFTRTSTTDAGTALWEHNYDLNPTTNGHVATDGDVLYWIDGGSLKNRVILRRIAADDAHTSGDDQVLTWRTGPTMIEWELPLFEDGALNDGYLRMSDNKQSYVRVKVGYNYLKVFYTTTGKDNEIHLGTLDNITTAVINTEWRAEFVDRELKIYRQGEFLGTIKDTKSVTAKGASNRGWAIGMVAGNRLISGQVTPASVTWVKIEDYLRYATTQRWTLLPVTSIPACRLRQARVQKIQATGSLLEWSEEVEDNFNYFSIGSPTDIIVREPGLYRVEATIQWDPILVPDVGHIIVLINGVETSVRDSKFMRGNVNAFGTPQSPGFSQTLSLSAPVRFAANDVLQLKAKYTASGSLLDQIFSYFDGASNIKSRFDLTFTSP